MTEQLSERARAMLDERVAMARETVAQQAWDRVELPAWVRDRWPGIDLTEPDTLPEPGACAEGRPWGVDAYGSVWGDLDARWRSYVDGRGARPCRNRWRDRDTLLCGTHLNAWRSTLDEAAKRVRRVEAHERATELARQLSDLGVAAEAATGGVLLRPDDARALIDDLGELRAQRAQLVDTGVTQAAADRDALLDLLGAVEHAQRVHGAIDLGALDGMRAAAERARRHLYRTTRTTPTPNDREA